MREQEQTSIHLFLAVTANAFSVMLVLVILAMSWELWVIPLIVVGCFIIWWFHIGRDGSEILYENICTGLMLTVYTGAFVSFFCITYHFL